MPLGLRFRPDKSGRARGNYSKCFATNKRLHRAKRLCTLRPNLNKVLRDDNNTAISLQLNQFTWSIDLLFYCFRAPWFMQQHATNAACRTPTTAPLWALVRTVNSRRPTVIVGDALHRTVASTIFPGGERDERRSSAVFGKRTARRRGFRHCLALFALLHLGKARSLWLLLSSFKLPLRGFRTMFAYHPQQGKRYISCGPC